MPHPQTPCSLVPRGGLDHPVFDQMGPRDQLIAVLTFARPQSDEALAPLAKLLDAWSEAWQRADPDEPAHCDEPWLGPTTMRIQVHNLVQPREAVAELVKQVCAAAPVIELSFARWAYLREEELLGPVMDPKAPEELLEFRSHEAYLRAVFDLAGPPPASEFESQLKGALQTRQGDILLEQRGMPLHLPPARICYGTAQATFVAPDARTEEVREALFAALDRSFAPLFRSPGNETWRPRPFDHTGALGRIDKLQLSHREGHGFAFPSNDLIHRQTATRFRFREHELMEALIEVIRALELAPIITWQRFGASRPDGLKSVQSHVFQLWERGRPLGIDD